MSNTCKHHNWNDKKWGRNKFERSENIYKRKNWAKLESPNDRIFYMSCCVDGGRKTKHRAKFRHHPNLLRIGFSSLTLVLIYWPFTLFDNMCISVCHCLFYLFQNVHKSTKRHWNGSLQQASGLEIMRPSIFPRDAQADMCLHNWFPPSTLSN